MTSTAIRPTRPARRLAITLACSAALPTLVAASVHAAEWPEEGTPVRIVVGFPPGGGVDTLARVISAPLGQELGANVIVENRPGAGGLLATELAAKAPADGYNLYIATPGSFTIWPGLRSLNYDPGKDFAAVSLMVTMPNLLLVNPDTPYKSVAELVAAAKSAGAKMNYASGGIGTLGQISAEQFNSMAGLKLTHVPYKGSAPAISDVMAGVVPVTFSDPSARAQVEGGKLRLLAVTTAKRSALFPDTPTMAEAGVPGFDVMNWYGLVAPTGTPPEVVGKLNAALVKVMADPEVQKRLAGAGMDATSSEPEQFRALMDGERAKWAALIKSAGIKAE